MCWDRLLTDRANDVMLVTYEDLSTEFGQTIERVADRISPGLVVTVPPPATRQLSDSRSEYLVARYRAERLARS